MKKIKREWYNYTLRDDRKVVQYGITKNPPEKKKEFSGVTGYHRVWEHISDGKNFTSYTIEKCPKTRARAKKRETEKILQYARTHKGKYPKYNKIL